MAKFEIVSKYKNEGLSLPARATTGSAGYDFAVAKDTVIPSYFKNMKEEEPNQLVFSTEQITSYTKAINFRPTLVPTGIKCQLDEGTYLELSVRSSTPLKTWIILANGVGIIDRDYWNNNSNEGEIFFQLINLSPYDIVLKKGEKIGQGIIKHFGTVEDDNVIAQERKGGFGSTS